MLLCGVLGRSLMLLLRQLFLIQAEPHLVFRNVMFLLADSSVICACLYELRRCYLVAGAALPTSSASTEKPGPGAVPRFRFSRHLALAMLCVVLELILYRVYLSVVGEKIP